MSKIEYVTEQELAALAKKVRMAVRKKQIEVARDMGVKSPSVHHAEESPALPYTKLRRKIIEAYSGMKISGPYYRLERSNRAKRMALIK